MNQSKHTKRYGIEKKEFRMFQAKTTNKQAKMFGGKVNHGKF